MSYFCVERTIGDKEIIIETGKMAKLADGAVVVKSNKNAVLVTACMSNETPEGVDFFPLTVNYIEKFYAAGKIPGGYIKREGKPTEKEILVSRLIDRPIRPLFPKNFFNEVQIIATTLSADQVYSADILGIIGASAALAISKIPFLEPVGAVRVTYKDGEFKINPSIIEVDNSQLDIVAAGTKDGITMVEGGAKEIPQEILLKALEIAKVHINEVIDLINELVDLVKPVKYVPETKPSLLSDELKNKIIEYGYNLIKAVNVNPNKRERSEKIESITKEILNKFEITEESECYKEAMELIENMEVEIVRKQILEEGIRPDGRGVKEIRPISIELDVLDYVHGSALFTRGQTQSLGVVTLGSSSDVQYIDSIEDEGQKRFMLHYNFPPFSTGEVKKTLTTSRREIGHGHLAERAIEAVLPDENEFPYTIRMVSEILESNGSSSMATVCSSSLALMASGVPIKKAVAGIAMGLVWDKESGKYKILSDIQGVEDHYGDMDFKVAGTSDGITAFQMDVKTIGLTPEMMKEALEQAIEGQKYILNIMNSVIDKPRSALSPNAPKIKIIEISENDIGLVIGSGGRVIKKIMAQTGVTISIEENGKVLVSSKDISKIDKAINIINHIINGFQKGEIIEGIISRIEDYGVFVELVPGQVGLLHKSSMIDKKGYNRNKYNIGDNIKVKISDIDDKKRISLSEVE